MLSRGLGDRVADLADDAVFEQLAAVGLQRPVYLDVSGSSYYFTTRDSLVLDSSRHLRTQDLGGDLNSQYDGMNRQRADSWHTTQR